MALLSRLDNGIGGVVPSLKHKVRLNDVVFGAAHDSMGRALSKLNNDPLVSLLTGLSGL